MNQKPISDGLISILTNQKGINFTKVTDLVVQVWLTHSEPSSVQSEVADEKKPEVEAEGEGEGNDEEKDSEASQNKVIKHHTSLCNDLSLIMQISPKVWISTQEFSLSQLTW